MDGDKPTPQGGQEEDEGLFAGAREALVLLREECPGIGEAEGRKLLGEAERKGKVWVKQPTNLAGARKRANTPRKAAKLTTRAWAQTTFRASDIRRLAQALAADGQVPRPTVEVTSPADKRPLPPGIDSTSPWWSVTVTVAWIISRDPGVVAQLEADLRKNGGSGLTKLAGILEAVRRHHQQRRLPRRRDRQPPLLAGAGGKDCESAPNRDPPGFSAYYFDCTGDFGT